MSTYQQRVIDEKRELDDKRGKLSDFMHSDDYAGLSAVDQGLLMVQLASMEGYANALARRIETF